MGALSYLMAVLGVLFIAVGIGVSIALHELGHLIPAKRFGVVVRQYMIGFGPTIWSRRRGETEYGFKAVPLGGFVRMIGMLPPRPGDDPDRLRASSTGRFSQLADQARADSMEEIRPGEQDRVFYKLSVPKKVLVMLGGPLVNLVLGAALLTGYVTLYGVPDGTRPDGVSVASVTTCVVPDAVKRPANATGDCTNLPPAPAYAAGLRPGDRILSIGGAPVRTTADVATLIRPKMGTGLPIQIQRGSDTMTFTVTPAATSLPKIDAAGRPVLDSAGRPVPVRAGYIGIGSRQMFQIVPQPLTDAPRYVGQVVGDTAGVMLRIPEKMAGVWQAAFGAGERDPNGPVSVVGVSRFAGEKAGGQITGSIIDDIAVIPFLVQLLAVVNIALFVFNLVPLMPLDGGQVAGALWEGLRRQVARIAGRPDPGPVDVARALPLAYAVSVLLIGMSVLLIYADIVKPVRF